MSSTESPATPSQQAEQAVVGELERELGRNWKDEYTEDWLGNRLAQEALMTDRIQRQQQAEEASAWHVRELAGIERPQLDEEEVGVSIGNKEFHIHNHGGTAPQAKDLTSANTGLGTAAKIGLALALLGGGAGVGYTVNEVLSDSPSLVDTDTDTISVIDFPEE